MDQWINKAVKVAVQIQSDRLHDEAQAENQEFLKNLDENIPNIIKEQVKEQVKVQFSEILSKIEQTVNEQLEAEVLTRSSNSLKTSYVVVADLLEIELKKILIEKMEGNKFLDTYGEVVTLKRRRDDDADKDEEPSIGSDRGSKRRREGKEPESTSAPKEKATRTTGKSTQGSKSQQRTASEADEKLYKFKEGDFKRLRIRNPKRSNLKSKEAYTSYSNLRGLIHHNKDKQNRMKYLPQTIWRKSNKETAAAMIQAIDKQLKTRRIMRSLERFVGGRLYEGDFRMLQQTI
nr:hypothetical protein [Tanacetum cinerariifolium]